MSDAKPVSDVAFTPAVKAVQGRLGSRASYEKMERGRGWSDRVTPEFAHFISQRTSFYMATATKDGQPYVQHRGGPAGFLRILDDSTLAFADFGGNRQYISIGNLSENDRAFLFLMDYENQQRIKIWGRAKVIEGDPSLIDQLADRGYSGRPERVFVFSIEAWDANCPQHIPRLFPEDVVDRLRRRVAELEREVESLRLGG